MSGWDPRLRVVLSAALIIGLVALMRAQSGDMRLAVSELAAIPLAFAIYIGATGLQALFGKRPPGDDD